MILPPHSVLLVEWNGNSLKKENIVTDNSNFGGLEH